MNVICGLVVVVIVFGLLCLINSVAANALFSLFVASNYVAWGVPILCRLIWGKDRFYPGEFYTGWFSKPIATVAFVWLCFGLVLSMFPSNGPNPSRKSCQPAVASVLTHLSERHELHHCAEWLRLACQHGILRPLCEEMVHGTEDHGREREQRQQRCR